MITAQIEQDTDAESPREWSNVGTIVTWHRRYNLGDEQPNLDPQDWRRDLAATHVNADYPDDITEEHVDRILEKHFIILPVYMHDHSGIALSTTGFSCPWDSGQLGWIYCTKEHGIKECDTVEAATKCLIGEIETYSQFVSGDVWGFTIEEDGDIIDSCWGFYGRDPKENGMTDNVAKEYHDALIQAAA